MSLPDIRTGDVGTAFVVTVVDESGAVVDISAATTKQILFKKPTGSSGSSIAKTATFDTDGTDGKLKYVTVANDINAGDGGTWSIEGYVELGGNKWYTDVKTFQVSEHL